MSRWQFWIDVGGTFTDCFALRSDGELLRHKVLSSGATKGAVGESSTGARLVDSGRIGDPDDFWNGYQLRLLDADGQLVEASTVERFDSSTGALALTPPLTTPPRPRQAYELDSGEGAPLLAIRYLLGAPLSRTLPSVSVRLGTTRGTNALITRGGARTALVTTRGFEDILLIGNQNRPRLFDLAINKPTPLFSHVVEIDERIAADGEVLLPPSEPQVRDVLRKLRDTNVESLAICLLNAYAEPAHEQLVEHIAREIGFEEISVSSRVAPLMKIVSRGDTTVVDAYLNPVLRRYVANLRASLGEQSDLRLLTSAGGLVEADHFIGKDSILSGPAGGVVGFSRVAQAAGFTRAIGFDMGGTSTDVSRFDGRFELQYETEKAGVRVVAPMMAIETVAAGGGSICHFDGVKLAVGPASAGSDPGPACYGRGGPLAVTDVNFALGKILPEHFPFPLDRQAVDRRLAALCEEVAAAAGARYRPIELADGLLRVACANMAKAIRSISVAKGYDPRDYVLVAFGGAAPQHACAVARELGMRQVLLHRDAGILSAYGIGMADVTRHRAVGVYRPYSESLVEELAATFEELERAARQEVVDEGIPADRIDVVRSLDLRYRGAETPLNIVPHASETYAQAFHEEHQRTYGVSAEDRPLEVVVARVEVTGRSAEPLAMSQRVPSQTRGGETTVTTHFDAEPHPTAVFQRGELKPGDIVVGPAIVLERVSTIVVDPQWRAEVLSGGELLLEADLHAAAVDSDHSTDDLKQADPVLLEIFNNQFAGIAEQMGITLRNTSSSVNVKERLDFSCALFTPSGDLVVNAPHIPVHLGAMAETVKRIIADNPVIRAGDAFVTNDPYRGGSHLPDVTVVTPVHGEDERLLFFTASRAHHAEIGGIAPGSMPPFSRNLAEEGVLIRNFKLVDAGQSRLESLRQRLLSGDFPTRNVRDNLEDVQAQLAANQQGVRDLRRLIDRYTLPVVEAYMRHIQDAAERKMRTALAGFPDGRHEFVDHLDDGSPIAVAVEVNGETATIDFRGTGPVLPGNLNANRAIVTAAVMYVLRCMIDEDIPLNQGVLAPVEIVLPECLLNPPERESPKECAAVAGGNVETSQRVVDVLLGALRLAAASQGTMNNLTFGDGEFGYYETICGGAGATRQADGADAVHTHMTNTRLTDPEVLERRYPVRLLEFSIRRGSGGRGAHRGGCGVVRRIEFLRQLELAIISQRRGDYAPYGLDGGECGAVGRNLLERAEGGVEILPERAQRTVQPGDVLTIETPGGGGYGEYGGPPGSTSSL
ncbi:MAG: hydantoinase B/oxoprolinase family protein [Pirellulaceae bacterium]